jgi:hypothetical protein
MPYTLQIVDQLTNQFTIEILTYVILGGMLSFLGSLIRIIKRDEQDLDDKLKFFYLKDLFSILVWTLVGAFIPITIEVIRRGVPFLPPTVLFLPLAPFAPKSWDFFEEHLPDYLTRLFDGAMAGIRAMLKNR